MFLLLGIMPRLLFHRWLLNPHFWHMFFRPRGILQTLKLGILLGEYVGIMLSFMLWPNTDLSRSLRVQKSSLDWWCRLLVGRCCWMRSTTLSCLLTLGLRRCMLNYLPMYDNPT